MGILTPQGETGWLHAGAELLDTQLRDGDGMGWPGDPRLDLRVGVVQATIQGKRRTGRRYEVWRRNEDGTETIVGHWRLEEFDRILFDMMRARMDTPGFVPVEERIDAHNAEIEDRIDREAKDSLGEMMEHAAKLQHDTENPRNVFRGIPGLRDEPKAPDA